jgi:hypothetical protein
LHRGSRDHGLGVVNDVHHDGAGAMGPSMLREVVRARKLLSALAALKRLLLGVE